MALVLSHPQSFSEGACASVAFGCYLGFFYSFRLGHLKLCQNSLNLFLHLGNRRGKPILHQACSVFYFLDAHTHLCFFSIRLSSHFSIHISLVKLSTFVMMLWMQVKENCFSISLYPKGDRCVHVAEKVQMLGSPQVWFHKPPNLPLSDVLIPFFCGLIAHSG